MFVLATVIKYAIAFFLIGMIIKFAEKNFWLQKTLIIHPWTLFIIPFMLIGLIVMTYLIIPDCSLAFILFLLGYIIGVIFGLDPNEPAFKQSQFARTHGNVANTISNILMAFGVIWGIANFF